jgi:hypothetical protein
MYRHMHLAEGAGCANADHLHFRPWMSETHWQGAEDAWGGLLEWAELTIPVDQVCSLQVRQVADRRLHRYTMHGQSKHPVNI